MADSLVFTDIREASDIEHCLNSCARELTVALQADHCTNSYG